MSATTTRLDRWLKPRLEARENDTLREINDDPSEVVWLRGNAQIGTLIVRIASAPASAFSTVRGTASNATQATVTILAPANTAFKRNDRLSRAGGDAWVITAIAPDRRTRTEAVAETA